MAPVCGPTWSRTVWWVTLLIYREINWWQGMCNMIEARKIFPWTVALQLFTHTKRFWESCGQSAGTWEWAYMHSGGRWLYFRGDAVLPSSVMTTQSGVLPDRVSARLSRLMVYASAWAQGERRYLNTAHIKTEPRVVASSKLVPFEIQQTLRCCDEPCVHYQTARWARAFSESNCDIYNIHGHIYNVFKAPKCWGWSNAM